jgi:hypothetical protein
MRGRLGARQVMHFHACPRCQGSVLETPPHGKYDVRDDGHVCVNCGWRRRDVTPGIMAEVNLHLGKDHMDNRHIRDRIGRGKAPLSGWDRVKRRRELVGSRVAQGPSTPPPSSP